MQMRDMEGWWVEEHQLSVNWMDYLLEEAPRPVRRATHLVFLCTFTAMFWFVAWAVVHQGIYS